MKPFSINKTQYKLIYYMYNKNQNSQLLVNSREIDQALKLCDICQDMFYSNRLSHSEYSFHIRDLGALLSLIKYNNKFESEL